MENNDLVRDDEELYRRVRSKSKFDEYFFDRGRLIINPAAFNDPHKKPSVDRAELIEHNPYLSRKDKTEGIVSLVTIDVRTIKDVETKTEEREVIHAVEVVYDPTPDNSAHSQITVNPDFFDTESKQKKTFRKLRVALAKLATKNGWTIEPSV